MKKIPIDDCPACVELDILAAEAAGFVRVPWDEMKATPPELEDVPATANEYVYCVEQHDGGCRTVWYRHHAAGDSHEWRPSTCVKDAWFLVRSLVHHRGNKGDSRWYFTMYSNPFEKFVVVFHHSDGREPHRCIDEECLAITKAFCSAMGKTTVEVGNAES